MAFGHAGRLRHVADRSLLRGYSENLTASFKDGADAAGGNVSRANALGDLLIPRSHGREVAGQTNVDRARLTGCEIELMQRAELLIDDGAVSSGSRKNVLPIGRQNATDFLAGRVVGKKGDRAFAIGQEVNFIADPQGIEIVGIFARDFLDPRIG